jgi:hypothetical protein
VRLEKGNGMEVIVRLRTIDARKSKVKRWDEKKSKVKRVKSSKMCECLPLRSGLVLEVRGAQFENYLNRSDQKQLQPG